MSTDNDQLFKASEIDFDEFDVPDIEAGAEFNPDGGGFRDPTPGPHVFFVKDFALKANNNFRLRGETYILHQIRPVLEVAPGQQQAGATIMDFLPMPTPGQEMPSLYLNQWCNFLRGLGFKFPKGRTKPEGFRLDQIIGRKVMAVVEFKLDADKNRVEKPGGGYAVNVKFFGYSPTEPGAAPPTQTPAANPVPLPPTGPAQVDLDNL